MIDVVALSHDDLRWSFSSEPKVSNGHTTWRSESVDPHPGSTHDVSLVRDLATRAFESWPVDIAVTITLSPYECTSRTNGSTSVDADYSQPEGADGKHPLVARIFLSGKRIAIHPATTRYLVPHEYGHVVEEVLNRDAGYKLGDGKLLAEYTSMRGVSELREYSGRTHSQSPGEVFANDFRVLIVGAEPEFWPHTGIARPEDVPAVLDWWERRRERVTKP